MLVDVILIKDLKELVRLNNEIIIKYVITITNNYFFFLNKNHFFLLGLEDSLLKLEESLLVLL